MRCNLNHGFMQSVTSSFNLLGFRPLDIFTNISVQIKGPAKLKTVHEAVSLNNE